ADRLPGRLIDGVADEADGAIRHGQVDAPRMVAADPEVDVGPAGPGVATGHPARVDAVLLVVGDDVAAGGSGGEAVGEGGTPIARPPAANVVGALRTLEDFRQHRRVGRAIRYVFDAALDLPVEQAPFARGQGRVARRILAAGPGQD